MLPADIKNIILDYHASLEEYPVRLRLHNDLFMYFQFKLMHRLNDEFLFIFYPGFYEDLHGSIVDI